MGPRLIWRSSTVKPCGTICAANSPAPRKAAIRAWRLNQLLFKASVQSLNICSLEIKCRYVAVSGGVYFSGFLLKTVGSLLGKIEFSIPFKKEEESFSYFPCAYCSLAIK